MIVVRCYLFVVCCSLSVFRYLSLLVVSCLLLVACCALLVVVVRCCCSVFVVRCALFVDLGFVVFVIRW